MMMITVMCFPLLLFGLLDVVCSQCVDVNAQVNCSFIDSMCGYQNGEDIGVYWERGNDQQHSHNISIDETDDPRVRGVWTDLISPPLQMIGDVCVVFQYLNQVCERRLGAAFRLYLQRSRGERKTMLREYYCARKVSPRRSFVKFSDRGLWLVEEVQISALPEDRLIFSGLQHARNNNNPDSFVSLGEVTVYPGRCPGQKYPAPHAGDCDFEAPGLCGYTQEEQGPHWRVVRKENLYERPEDDVEKAPPGYFLALTPASVGVTNNYREFHKSVAITSPDVDLNADGCIRFRYRNAPSMTILSSAMSFEVSTEKGTESNALRATYGDGVWVTHYQDVTARRFNMTFRADVDKYFTNYVAFDSVEVFPKSCQEVACMPDPCDVYVFGELCDGLSNARNEKCINTGKKFAACSKRIGEKQDTGNK